MRPIQPQDPGTGGTKAKAFYRIDKLGVTGSSPVPPIAESRWKQRLFLSRFWLLAVRFGGRGHRMGTARLGGSGSTPGIGLRDSQTRIG